MIYVEIPKGEKFEGRYLAEDRGRTIYLKNIDKLTKTGFLNLDVEIIK